MKPLELDWRNCHEDAIGGEHGITRQDLSEWTNDVTKAHKAVLAAGTTGFAGLPTNTEYPKQEKGS